MLCVTFAYAPSALRHVASTLVLHAWGSTTGGSPQGGHQSPVSLRVSSCPVNWENSGGIQPHPPNRQLHESLTSQATQDRLQNTTQELRTELRNSRTQDSTPSMGVAGSQPHSCLGHSLKTAAGGSSCLSNSCCNHSFVTHQPTQTTPSALSTSQSC